MSPTRFNYPLLLLLVAASRGHLAKQIKCLKTEVLNPHEGVFSVDALHKCLEFE